MDWEDHEKNEVSIIYCKNCSDYAPFLYYSVVSGAFWVSAMYDY